MITMTNFLKLRIGDEISHDGNLFIITSTGTHNREPYIGISDVELGDGIEIDDKPIPGTEYKLTYSEAKNHIEPLVELKYR